MIHWFQSTPPHGGRLETPQQASGFQFQSTPPHGGRQFQTAAMRKGTEVSIHAPARGATTSKAEVPSM